ncbi:putative quinol monooxygenase [Agromyces bauzanensis]|uniref:putative quinol monooxygenase n=1 Tax=Agromyces bauzanensis TaxID=1308924 RepID=UPI003570BA00
MPRRRYARSVIIRVSEAHVHRESRDEFLVLLHELVATFPDAYDGLLGHDVLIDLEDPVRIQYVSRWRDERALATYAGPRWRTDPVTFPDEERFPAGPAGTQPLPHRLTRFDRFRGRFEERDQGGDWPGRANSRVRNRSARFWKRAGARSPSWGVWIRQVHVGGCDQPVARLERDDRVGKHPLRGITGSTSEVGRSRSSPRSATPGIGERGDRRHQARTVSLCSRLPRMSTSSSTTPASTASCRRR